MRFGSLGQHWSRLSWASQVLLVMAVLASSAAAVILAIDLWLFIGGNAVGGNGVVFPVWALLLIYGGAPCFLLGSLMWVGYLVSSRHARKRGPD